MVNPAAIARWFFAATLLVIAVSALGQLPAQTTAGMGNIVGKVFLPAR